MADPGNNRQPTLGMRPVNAQQYARERNLVDPAPHSDAPADDYPAFDAFGRSRLSPSRFFGDSLISTSQGPPPTRLVKEDGTQHPDIFARSGHQQQHNSMLSYYDTSQHPHASIQQPDVRGQPSSLPTKLV